MSDGFRDWMIARCPEHMLAGALHDLCLPIPTWHPRYTRNAELCRAMALELMLRAGW